MDFVARTSVFPLSFGLYLADALIVIGVLLRLKRARWSLRTRKNIQEDRPEASKHVCALRELLAAQDGILKAVGFDRLAHQTLHGFADRMQSAVEFGGLAGHARWYRRYAAARYGLESQAAEVGELRPLAIPPSKDNRA